MEKTYRVIMFGNTLVLAGVKTSISLDPDCVTLTCDPTTSLQELAAIHPDALIFELDAVPGEFLYSLSRALPGLLLIGIDPETNRTVLWAGQEASDVTAHDLTRVIHRTGKTGPLGLLKKALKLKMDA